MSTSLKVFLSSAALLASYGCVGASNDTGSRATAQRMTGSCGTDAGADSSGGDSGGPPTCTGAPLTAQSQVQPNTQYCGGVAHEQIRLADGDTWVNGEVTGVATGQQRGAVECSSNCTLVNMNVHDNPGFAGLYIFGDNVLVQGGRFSNNGSLGMGDSIQTGITIDGVEIDHNGATGDCGFEAGGIKFVSHFVTIKNSYIHDNNCPGIWFDINAANNEIAHNRVIDNANEGIFYEISQDVVIHDNEVKGNGFKTNGNGCVWLWGGGITIASSFNVQIYANDVADNCNGITGTQQDRPDSVPPQHLLDNLQVHDNTISGPGQSGVASDNGADLSVRNISFTNNPYLNGQTFCGTSC
jgi:parallel beta-helix repeat protein